MAASIYDWSITAGNNATADADINWSEGMFPSVVNDSARQMMGRVAEYVGDNGIRIAAGTANAITLTTNAAITVPPQGMTVAFKALATNTGAVTLGLNGGGGSRLRKIFAGNTDAVDLDAADITAKGVYIAHFDPSANSGAGAWILINPTNNAAMQAVVLTSINNSPTKNTPVDDDTLVITDSADTNKTKRVLWSRIKAILKGYFDGLYLGLGGGVLTGALVLVNNLRIRDAGNRHLWFETDAGLVQGLLYNDAASGDMHIRSYAADGSSYVSFSVRRDGRVSLPGTVTNNTDATNKSYVDNLAANLLPLAGGTLTGELFSRSTNSLRLASGDGPAVILRKDTTNFYLLLTDTWNGSFNTLRPLTVDINTGAVNFLRPQTSRNPTEANDLTRKGYVDAGLSDVSSAASTAQTTANAANSAAGAAQSTANERIIRDTASHAGFAGGDAAQPYLRHNTSGTGTVVRLARYDQVPGIVAGQAVGAVGSFAMLRYTAGGNVAQGTTAPGSSLVYSNANAGDVGTNPSGTWRCMGFSSGVSSVASVTLWQRVS